MNQTDAQNTKRKTRYTIANEVIEEFSENFTNKQVHLEMNTESDAGTVTLITEHLDRQQMQMQSEEAIETNMNDAFCSNSKMALKPSFPVKKQDQYDMFGNFIAEVMRTMTKSESRKLQTDILGLISEAENAH